jgi:hypothetical protein
VSLNLMRVTGIGAPAYLLIDRWLERPDSGLTLRTAAGELRAALLEQGYSERFADELVGSFRLKVFQERTGLPF